MRGQGFLARFPVRKTNVADYRALKIPPDVFLPTSRWSGATGSARSHPGGPFRRVVVAEAT